MAELLLPLRGAVEKLGGEEEEEGVLRRLLALLLTREIAVVVATLRRTTRLMGMRARRGPACGSGATLVSAVRGVKTGGGKGG